MTRKQEYYQRLRSLKKPNDPDTLAVIDYFGDDNRYWYINSLDCRSFLGQSGHFMRELVLETGGDLTVILSKTQETLEPLIPPNLCDFDRVDWVYVGLNYLWGELFDEIDDW